MQKVWALLLAAGISIWGVGCSMERKEVVKEGSRAMAENVFQSVAEKAVVKDGVKEISYEQFMSIRNANEKYKLVDVLSDKSFQQGHIAGAMSLPLDTINAASTAKLFSKDAKIVVYCASFACHASTMGAKKLQELGYTNVLDYKGGLAEWQERGNALVRPVK